MIEVQHINCSYGKNEILSNLSFNIADGSFTSILGSNGCGKTTLLRCIAGVLEPQKGSVLSGGKPIGN